MSESYSIDRRKIVHDTIDGEVVSINLDTGNYYSMNSSAARIWNWIKEGANLQQILDHLKQVYNDQRSDIDEVLDKFIEELIAEGLIQEDSENSNSARLAIPESASSTDSHNALFDIPKIDKYTDMQEFLLVDPIHEVSEEGWPNKKGDATSA